MTQRQLLTSLVVAAALTVTAACGSGDESGEAGKIRLASNSNASSLTAWVALDQGIFEKNGLDVDYKKVENVGTLPPALGRSFDIVFVTPVQAIAAASQGIPVTEVAGSSTDTAENANSYLMVGEGSPIEELADMKDKTIGVLTEVGTLHYATLNMLKQAGVDPSEVEIKQVDGPSQEDQLAAGRVDAVETLAPFSQQLEQAGATSLGSPFLSLGDEISVIWWASTNEWVEDRPEEAKAFQDSLAEAEQWIAENDAEARKILQKYSGFPAEVVESFPLPDYDASVRSEDIDVWLKVMQDVVDFQGEVDTEKLTSNS